MIGLIAGTLLGISLIPYAVYLHGITFGKKQPPVVASTSFPPPISVVISAYNEEKNVEKRIKNLKDCNYPGMEIIFIDDHSSDDTMEKARFCLDKYEFSYHLIRNDTQRGVSASYNRGIRNATQDIIVLTDADVAFKTDALHKIVARLISDPKIGAVTGDLQPEQDNQLTTGMETQYRNVYGRMCDWESAIDSTFNFNGGLVAFKKRATGEINEQKGADDANIAFAAIRNGYRAVYEIDAVVYEKIPESFQVQYHQKIRRAKGLIEAVLANKEFIDRSRPFAKFFYLRAWMLVASPSLMILGAYLLLMELAVIRPSVMPLLVIGAAAILWISDFFRAFILNQIYLFVGLYSRKNAQIWESTSSLAKENK